MRYLTVVYYDTFARFFASVEDSIRQLDSEAEVLHLAIFPSGWMYLRAHRRNSRLLPVLLFRRPSVHLDIDDYVADKLSYYHKAIALQSGFPSGGALHERARRYTDLMASIIHEFSPDVVLLSGDTRVVCEALVHALNSRMPEVPRFYFEQGPNATTILDSAGVNANVSFREGLAFLTGDGYPPATVTRRRRFRRNPVYRGVDHILNATLSSLRRIPPEWASIPLKRISGRRYGNLIQRPANPEASGHELLVALQVPDDANNIHHNPLGLGDQELVEVVLYAAEQCGLKVRVREHPLYRRKYSEGLYQLVESTPGVTLSARSLDDDLAAARAVITVNSTTGVDAYIRGGNVLVLGNAYYDHLPGIVRVASPDDLSAALMNQIGSGQDLNRLAEKRARLFAELEDQYLIRGHYLDADLIAAPAVAVRLVSAARDSRVQRS